MKLNTNYANIGKNYLFAEIARRVETYKAKNPGAKIVRLGIGDVSGPLAPAVIEAMHKAVDDEATKERFHGYGPEQGYAFLREKIAASDYVSRGIDISADEIFVSDGAKSDCANFQELLSPEAKIAVADPVYPVYVDSNVMAGRGGAETGGRHDGIVYLECNRANGFTPGPDQAKGCDAVYLCFPNNPTGAVATRERLQEWVDWANATGALLLFDAAYESFVRTPGVPKSIYECEGARGCAVEFRSFSKTAGFTGTRCGFTVVPEGIAARAPDGTELSLRKMWSRRQTTMFNGASYISQRGAEAVYSPEGAAQCKAATDFYLENARLIKEALVSRGLPVCGGDDSPYLWVETGASGWDMFDRLLEEAQVVVTPGEGFGRAGAGFIRISSFNSRENTLEAIDRLGRTL